MQHRTSFFDGLQIELRMDMQVIQDLQVAGVPTYAEQEAAKLMEQGYMAWLRDWRGERESSRSCQDRGNKRTRSRSRHAP